jgi:hypothetical protein
MTVVDTGRTAARGSVTTKQKVGLALCGLYSLTNVPSALTPPPEGGGDAPPQGILVICSVLGVIGLVAAVVAWRGNRVALRVAAGAIIVITLTGLPAFFVDVPMWVRALVAASVVVTVAAVVLMFSGDRRPVAVHD